MSDVYFITGNKGKFKEIKHFLRGTSITLKQVALKLEELQGVDAEKIIKHKASEAIRAGYANFVLEDTSLYINGMGKLPGPLIKWFLAELKNEGIYKLAAAMGNKQAIAETILAYAKNKKIRYFKAATRGLIVEPSGDKDFGWGPIFQPTGAGKSFGQMSPAEKHRWSMRIKAFKKFKEFLDGADY